MPFSSFPLTITNTSPPEPPLEHKKLAEYLKVSPNNILPPEGKSACTFRVEASPHTPFGELTFFIKTLRKKNINVGLSYPLEHHCYILEFMTPLKEVLNRFETDKIIQEMLGIKPEPILHSRESKSLSTSYAPTGISSIARLLLRPTRP